MPNKTKSRIKPFAKGVKSGMAKKTIDNTLSIVTEKVAEIINEKLAGTGVDLIITQDVLDEFMKCVIMLGLAEMADLASEHVGEQYGSKMDMLADFMREYAGEKVGQELVDVLFKIVPIVFGAFSGLSAEELDEAAEKMVADNISAFENLSTSLQIEEEEEQLELVEA